MFRLVLLGGFLGAGKTTTALTAARLLRAEGHRVAIVTNDQGTDLVDTHLAAWQLGDLGAGDAPGRPWAAAGFDVTVGEVGEVAVGEVTGGCFCCRFEDLADTVRELVGAAGADTVFAEAVGSCADLQATVIRPLRRYYGEEMELAPLTTVVEPARIATFADPAADPELAYLFDRQLEEADVIALNKIDARPPNVVAHLVDELRRRYPYALVVPYSGARDVRALRTAWAAPAPTARDMAVDYDRYAAAEARLAWLNAELRIEPKDGRGFDPSGWAATALTSLSEAGARAGRLIGHAKLSIRTPTGLTKASLVAAGAAPTVDLTAAGPVADEGIATLNIRMACHPVELDGLVRAATRSADEETAARSVRGEAAAFTPSYPRPVHRLSAAYERSRP